MTAALLALSGNVLITKRAKDKWDVMSYIRIQKMVNGRIPWEMDYDLNGDGVIDEKDATILKKIVLYG